MINLRNEEDVNETRISIHLEVEHKKELVELLQQYIDVFSRSYDDMLGLCIDIVSHWLPTDPAKTTNQAEAYEIQALFESENQKKKLPSK